MKHRILLTLMLFAVTVLAGCAPVGASLFPIEPKTLNESETLADAPVARFLSIPGNSTRSVQVDVDPSYGEQIIVMTEGNFLRAYDGSRHVASSSTPDRFISLEIVGLDLEHADSIVPAISVNSPSDYQCIGPCVAVDAADEQGVLTIEIDNPSPNADVFPIYVVAASYFDTREYDNDTRGSAFPLSGSSSTGALETLFDEDWFSAVSSGSHVFRAPSAFDLRVRVYDGTASASEPAVIDQSIEAGTSQVITLFQADYVQLTGAEYGATAATSWYEITMP
ncbi:MAG: hypothetical protein LC667_09945 [Thioalkalivibrio sp.]|nr:hypothetical protein [Thioalkalivibrio sp.]